MKSASKAGKPNEKKKSGGALLYQTSMPKEDDRPATKRDLDLLRTEFKSDMGELRAELNANMERLHDDLVERMRDMQTEVLRAFHSWARPIEIRLRSFDDMQQRLGLLEERISIIERGKTSG
jgi:hypothetical protein